MPRQKSPVPLRISWLLTAFVVCVAVVVLPAPVWSQSDSPSVSAPIIAQVPPPRPPIDVRGVDVPNDDGGAITVHWGRSPDDGAGANGVTAYKILRAPSTAGPFDTIGTAAAGQTSFIDASAQTSTSYVYEVAAVAMVPTLSGERAALLVPSDPSPVAHATAQWFHRGRLNALIAVIILCSAILYFIAQAKGGRPLFIRKIAGLEAVDEAVGRATEMGRKIFYIPGTQDMDEVQTLAGITILGRVAKVAAAYGADLEIPVSRSLVMVTCREVVKESYSDAGHPDAYKEDSIYYLTDEQWGYAAGIDGLVIRHKPATMFFMGAFYAESLLLAETANSVGAIQIAGTAMPAQLPFFVAACDYTLIGEELFAASAYLSKEPKLLGSLKGQDVGKAIILFIILIGVILTSIGALTLQTSDPDTLGWFNIGRLFDVQ
ncbi:MAG: fibronectin type III domain-containing protein [Candidatus Zixiibacteriota bacterium]